MKKKVVSVLMAAAMVAGMAGCGSSNTGNAGTTNSNASTNMVHLTAVTNSMMTALVYLLTGQVPGQPT